MGAEEIVGDRWRSPWRLAAAIAIVVGACLASWLAVGIGLTAPLLAFGTPHADEARTTTRLAFAMAALLVLASGPVAWAVGRRPWLLLAPVALAALTGLVVVLSAITGGR